MPPRKLIVFGFALIALGILIYYAGNVLNNTVLYLVAIPVGLSGVRPLLPKPQDDETYRRELKSEERRAVILLGFLGAIVAFDLWLRDNDPTANPTFNFICDYPCPHITFSWIPFLDRLIYLWFLWAGSMVVYFSEDIFQSWKISREFRQVFRGQGHGFLILWPLLFAWTIFFQRVALSSEIQCPNGSTPSTGCLQSWSCPASLAGRLRRLQDSDQDGGKS